MRLRNFLYDKNFMPVVESGSCVISIGNLTWGGTGKTAMAAELARFLISKGLRVAIVSRGYRRKSRGPLLVSDGTSLNCGWRQCGDEAFLLAVTVPDAIVAVAEERSDALPLLKPLHADVILLDDAFQHRKIKRDLDIVLIDASEDITKQRRIPFGKLREEPSAAGRGDAVILTHENQAHIETLNWIRKNIHLPVFGANYALLDQGLIHNKRIGAFCAIGSPHHFFRVLRDYGADLVMAKSFRDHHAFSREEILDLRRDAKEKGAEFIVTTSKDGVRIDPEWMDDFIRVPHVKLQITEESLFFDFVMKRLYRSAKISERLP